MARSRKQSGRKKVSAKKWREEQRGGSIYLKIPEGIGTFDVKAETYRLDFMPFVAGKGNPRAEEGEEYFERTFFIHRDVGPNQDWHLCAAKTFGKPCPICEFRAKQMADPNADEDLVKTLAPKERQLWLLRNLQDDPKQTLLWEYSYHLFGKQLRDKINNADEEDGYDYFADAKDGYTVRVAFAQSDRGKWKEAVDIEFRQRKTSYDPDIAEEMPCLDDLLVATPYAKLKALFLQTEDADDDDSDEGASVVDDSDDDEPMKKERPAKSKKKGKAPSLSAGDTVFYKGSPCEVLKVGGDGSKLIVEDMDGETHKITTDDLDDGPPPKEEKKKSKKKEPEKDDDSDDDWDWDDDAGDDEEKPKSKSKAKPKEEDDSDDSDDSDDDWDWDDD
jgi:hypothetical protein